MRLFVYGSLMRGEAHAGELGPALFLGPARTAAAYTLVNLGAYPAMLPGGATAVVGEVYEVSDVARLDEFEEPSVYRRGPVALADGTAAEAYFLAEPPGPVPVAVIRSGDWRAR
jgi:gamma-glutamylaminecyclotransferase